MMPVIFEMFGEIISQCSEWAYNLHEAMGTTGYVIAAVIVVLVVSLLIIPLRGSSLNPVGTSFVGDMARQFTYKPKYWNGKRSYPTPGYKGKYEKRKYGGHRAQPKG